MHRTLKLAIVTTVAIGSIAAWLFRGDIATLVMARGAAANLGADRIAELPDGLHVAFCGAGSPLPDPKRSGPCVAVIAGTTMLVVDAGSGGTRNLQRMGLRPGRLAAVLLTHFHSDHIDGLGELAMQRWVGAAHEAPLPVHGPPGVEHVVAGFNQAYHADFGYRTAHHGEAIAPSSGAGSQAAPFDLPPPGELREIWSAEGLVVRAFAVAHEPAHPAVGYRFDYGGRSVVISGDTVKLQAVADAARDVDLLLHEALAPHLVARLTDAAEQAGQHGVAKITRDIVDYHTSPVDAARVAEAAGVDALVLYHIVPPLLVPGAEQAFLQGVDAVFDGPVTVARDGTFISLPAGTDAIEH
jgi:ribonuclease Z